MSSSRMFYRINGETIESVTETIHSVHKSADFISNLADLQGMCTPLLPAGGSRLYRKNGNRGVWVFEDTPRRRAVKWYWTDDDTPAMVVKDFNLAIPYVVYVFRTNGGAIDGSNCQVFFRTRPLNTLSDMLCVPCLPNIHQHDNHNRGASCKVCFGTVRAAETDALCDKVASLIPAFWGSQFNTDLHQNYSWMASRDAHFLTPQTWHKSSDADDLFVLNATYQPACTLAEAIAYPQ